MKHVSRIRITALAAAVVAFTIIAGCASAPLRTEEASTSGIRAAQEAEAAQVPQSSLHLQLAREELELARNLSAKGEKDKASSMLLRAEADAELAVVLSREDAERAQADAAVVRVRQLRRDYP